MDMCHWVFGSLTSPWPGQPVGLLVDWSVNIIISYQGGKLQLQAHIGALIIHLVKSLTNVFNRTVYLNNLKCHSHNIQYYSGEKVFSF